MALLIEATLRSKVVRAGWRACIMTKMIFFQGAFWQNTLSVVNHTKGEMDQNTSVVFYVVIVIFAFSF